MYDDVSSCVAVEWMTGIGCPLFSGFSAGFRDAVASSAQRFAAAEARIARNMGSDDPERAARRTRAEQVIGKLSGFVPSFVLPADTARLGE